MSLLSRSSLHRRPELVSLIQRLPHLPILSAPPPRARLPPPAPSTSPAPPSMASSDLVHLLHRQCRRSFPILTPATISSATRSAKATLADRYLESQKLQNLATLPIANCCFSNILPQNCGKKVTSLRSPVFFQNIKSYSMQSAATSLPPFLGLLPDALRRSSQVEPREKVKISDKRNIQDYKRRLLADKYELRRQLYKALCRDPDLPAGMREKARYKLSKLPRNSAFTRVRNRCVFTGRSRGCLKKFRMSRIVFRTLAGQGELNGVTKASW